MLQRNSSSISPSFLYHSILLFTQLQGPKVEEDRDKDSVMPQVMCSFAGASLRELRLPRLA